MAKKYAVLITMLFILPLSLMLVGCGEYGRVDQGRVIEYDKAAKTVTIIRDKSIDPKKPDYSVLPPMKYQIPDNPAEMGPMPKPGKRMKLDTEKKQIVIYNTAKTNFETITYTLIEQKHVESKDPLVYDVAADKAKVFPVVDQQKKTIAIYSRRLKEYVNFSVPEQYFAMPADTWDNGDEVRIYFKQEGKSLRLMNITKTDIFKK